MTTQIVTKIEMISAAGCANIMPFNPKILFKIIIDGIKIVDLAFSKKIV